MTDFIRNHLKLKQQAATTKRSTHKAKRGTVNKSRLPNPSDFYRQFDITVKGGSGWQMVKCPFHDDTHASMGVNREHGGYRCHACGACGDCIGFYMQWYSVSFIDACQSLQLIEGCNDDR
ncbi:MULTISPECIES: CHC2 zinc finger domain-containing protein [Psychrobacter]|uniref:CHC2 zinc finger family protein n=1 Tax=Psychrobacter alimentarius TaxID=261164 RepID=A0ABM5ZWS8_9GAMM|nr:MULTISPECIES: CHC2 zinc finger domain-containing protein [Psychrobacter]AMT96569.1 CHC2 zinc finger family protein [Psychrobacter alimentarius]